MCDMKSIEKVEINLVVSIICCIFVLEKNNTMSKKNYTLENVDGNAFAIMAYVSMVMRREGKSNEEIGNYLKDVQSGDYRHLIDISVEMCERLNEKDGSTRLVLVDWDDDGENMPTKVKIPTDIDDEDVADYLSDTYGFCVNEWYDINE